MQRSLYFVLPFLLVSCGPSAQEIKLKKIADKKAESLRAEQKLKKRLADERRKLIDSLKSETSRSMLDPSSVQYRSLSLNEKTLCGELNGKNAYGAYTGFKQFVTANGNSVNQQDLDSAMHDMVLQDMSTARADRTAARFQAAWLICKLSGTRVN